MSDLHEHTGKIVTKAGRKYLRLTCVDCGDVKHIPIILPLAVRRVSLNDELYTTSCTGCGAQVVARAQDVRSGALESCCCPHCGSGQAYPSDGIAGRDAA
jgi:hypothetical protein